ncbi:MAG TPA: ribbon-helix-helix domain-containing protein [Mycobacteriales bacterium]|nr:ribbon-helix-helix domain-containing protein [Mycobacteriales bacterium]
MSERLDPGPAVDLDKEDVRDVKGRRITTKRAESMADEAIANLRRQGRPSLGSGVSPKISVRVTQETYDALDRLSADVGRSVSELVRAAASELARSSDVSPATIGRRIAKILEPTKG